MVSMPQRSGYLITKKSYDQDLKKIENMQNHLPIKSQNFQREENITPLPT
jgi:hypothetical protein